jgi:hypothetical protein
MRKSFPGVFIIAFLLISANGSPGEFTVYVIPEGGVYAGDPVSFLVLPAEGVQTEGLSVRASFDGEPLGEAAFDGFGIGGRPQATLKWVWDTAGLVPDSYTLDFEISPGGDRWTETIQVQPAPSVDHAWESVSNACCILYFVSGTASSRDLDALLAISQSRADVTMAQMGVTFAEPLEMVLLPRVLGHGGFAWGELYVSYLDRNYAGDQLDVVVHHEMVHVLDERLGGKLHPSMLTEGLAVYLTGGHFKREPLFSRAATLQAQGIYVPLERLANNFYNEQHEIGYLQAGALIEYMVERWGYPAFDAFYRDIPFGTTDAQAIDGALQAHFDLSLARLEADFTTRLRTFPFMPDLAEDVAVMVAYFDAVRAYQLTLDPNAYFLQAWLLKIDEMQAADVTADYVQHPQSASNITLETLLIAARDEYETGRYTEAEEILGAVDMVLAAMRRGEREPFSAHPLAANYYQVVIALLNEGYQPHAIHVAGGQATAWVSVAFDSIPQQVILHLDGSAGWRLE